MTTIHLGKTIPSRFGRMAIHACNGRATSNPFSVTDSPALVTCKRCRAKLPQLAPTQAPATEDVQILNTSILVWLQKPASA